MTTQDFGFIHSYVPGQDVTLLLLHGTGGNEGDLIPLGQELLPGAALLSPRGKVLENGMPRFFRRLAEGVFDQQDLKLQTGELTRFITAAARKYELPGKIIAVGYSNGANIAASILLTNPEVLAGAVLFRAMVPFVPQATAHLKDVSVLLCAGQRDPIIVPEQTSMLADILKKAGAQVSIHMHPGGHELGLDDVRAAKTWLADWTQKPLHLVTPA